MTMRKRFGLGLGGFLVAFAILFAGAAQVHCGEETAGAIQDEDAPGPGWTALFNGEDLTGWKATGKAAWTVDHGCIVGRQGANNAPGDLFTKEEFGDFELRLAFKMQWPANSGVWFRYQAPNRSYQADILEYKNPVCYAGSLYCPGKMFLALNENPDIVKRDQWNTMTILAQGDHLVVTLNGVVTADVHEDSFKRGKIGFQVHPGDQFKDMQIAVRKIFIRRLDPAK